MAKRASPKKSKPGQKKVVQPKAAADKGKPADKTTRGVSAKAMEDLLRARRIAKKDTRGIADRFGKLMAKEKYLDRQAFNVIALGDGMEPERLRQYRDNIMHYFDISGLDTRANSVTPMPFGPGGESDEDDDAETGKGGAEAGDGGEAHAEENVGGNVHKFPLAAE